MTAEPINAEPIQFQTKRRSAEEKAGDVVLWQLDDDDTVLTARRPKMAVLLELVQGLESESQIEQVNVFDRFLDQVLDEDSAEHLRERFRDPEDDLDMDSLDGPLQYLVGKWYNRPTGSRRAGAASPRRTGRASTVRSRSKGSTR